MILPIFPCFCEGYGKSGSGFLLTRIIGSLWTIRK
jgi:hypothetical protein